MTAAADSFRRVAALYVDPRGPYPKLLGPEFCWDEARDARKYDGPWSVVAHPPCKNWSSLRHLATTDERDCGIAAVNAVRKFGGVLEQPKGSKLFEHCRLPMPALFIVQPWEEWSIEVEQVAWGHVARKKTWIYGVGISYDLALAGVRTGGVITHWCSGVHTKGARGETPPGIKVCSAQQRRRTPPLFAEWLVSLARSVQQ